MADDSSWSDTFQNLISDAGSTALDAYLAKQFDSAPQQLQSVPASTPNQVPLPGAASTSTAAQSNLYKTIGVLAVVGLIIGAVIALRRR